MSLFGKIVKTTINVGIGLPVAVVKDVFTLGGAITRPGYPCHTSEQLDLIKKEADE
jgi:hypothetical protein